MHLMPANIALHMITVSLLTLQRESIHKNINNAESLKTSYDYIVVGAGSAGSVVANRLTEEPNINVLLLEAGETQSIITDIPALAIPLWKEIPIFDWSYQTVPQKYGLSLKEPGVFGERRGKVIGGTSSINGLIHVIGNKLDFDNWAKVYGADGWSYAELLPYFRKLENNSDQKILKESAGYHGTKGPIGIVSDPNPSFVLQKLQNAYNELGYPTIDLNGPKQCGTAFTQMTVKNGYRSNTGNAYIDPNPHPNNLFISANSLVTKILFTEVNGEIVATGVEFKRNGKKLKVYANREVIISAGVFNSPQLLMLSGVGPKEHLKSFGIPVIMDLPVGNNLQDHPKVVFLNLLKNQSLGSPEPLLTVEQLGQFFTDMRGPLASYSCLYMTYTTKNNPQKEWPNVVLAGFIQTFKNNLTEVCAKYGDRINEWKEYYKPYLGKYYLRSDANLRRPRSFGSVRLSSTDPFCKPLIDPNFFNVTEDLNDLVESAKYLLFVLQKSSFAKYLDFNTNPIPGCTLCRDRPMYACDSYVRCYIKLNGEKELHPVGTCRMGNVNRDDVVVDSRLRVKNICGLRVCDASIMPTVPNGNSNTPSIMIGEKCSDLVKEDMLLKTNRKRFDIQPNDGNPNDNAINIKPIVIQSNVQNSTFIRF